MLSPKRSGHTVNSLPRFRGHFGRECESLRQLMVRRNALSSGHGRAAVLTAVSTPWSKPVASPSQTKFQQGQERWALYPTTSSQANVNCLLGKEASIFSERVALGKSTALQNPEIFGQHKSS